MKLSQSIWYLLHLDEMDFYIKTTQHNRKVQRELQWSTFRNDKVTVWGRKGAEKKQKKVHLTSQRVKIILHTNFEQLGKYRYIQYQRSLRCYPTMFPGGTWGQCISAEMLQSGGGGCTICWSSKPLWMKGFVSPLFSVTHLFVSFHTGTNKQAN